jgi:hypothetical protein
MAVFDTRNDAEYGMGLSATLSGTTKAEGDWIDMQGWQSVTFSVGTGTVTDAGTASGLTAVADADLVGTEAALTVTSDTDDDKMIGSIGYIGSKRYVRMTAVGTTGTNAVVNVHATKRMGANMGSATIDSGTAAT